MASTLAELLADHGIPRLRTLSSGHFEQVVCPKCEGGRTHEKSLSVTIDADGLGAAWQCHRGTCPGMSGGGRLHADHRNERPRLPKPEEPRPTRKPEPHPRSLTEYRPTWFDEFWDARCIGDRTIRELGIYAIEDRRFPEIGESRCIVFPFFYKRELVNRKYRPVPAKHPMSQDKDALATLFNVDRISEGQDVYWVEGEPDVAALFECGIENVVTLKDGAPKEATFKADDKRFEALRTHSDLLMKQVKQIILAGDTDQPGLALRDELARRLGRHRCLTVTWPEGCKDAGEVLQRHGAEAVLGALRAAEPYPIEGLQRVTAAKLLALRERPPPATMSTGTLAGDEAVKLPTEGRVIIVTGFPGSGKTAYVKSIMLHTAEKHDRKWLVCSPEMQPWEEFAAACAVTMYGKSFWPSATMPSMSYEEIADAGSWMERRVQMLVCDSEDEAPTLEWWLDRTKCAILRDGVTDSWWDPWNEMDHSRPPGMTETDYIGRSLQQIRSFGLRHGCNMWITAHPTKPLPLRPGETRGAPGPYDISGSAHWFNKADLGLTVHSPQLGAAEIHVWKAKYLRLGKRGNIAHLDYDETTGQYKSSMTQPSSLGPAQPSDDDD